tara:strand:+ start:8318 stop:9880 length:1563 start_codon:yes stop_codon:yes gene_type:complete
METNNNFQSKIMNSINNEIYEDNIDLSKLFKVLIRKKIFFISIVSTGFFLSILYAKIRAPIWQGQFEIVIDREKSPDVKNYDQFISNNQLLSSLTGPTANSLQTEVKILESPSILQPVFNFVKEEKLKLKPNKKFNRSYLSWSKNSLKIKLLPETSVLSIKYQDKDKSLIIPVLKKISTEYQKYSFRDNQKSISQGISYLEDQLEKVKIESDIAISNLQEFSSKNLMGNEEGLPLSSPFLNANSIDGFPYDLQSNERQLLQIKKLRALESKLVEMSAVLTPESSVIKTLNKKIIAYKQSLSRPKDVLLEFRNLQRISTLKEKLLIKLEAELAALKLDQAKQTDPWELISTPTLFNNPSGLSSKIIVFIGSSIAILLGGFASIIYERISGKLFEIDQFVKILQIPTLKTLFRSEIKKWINSIDLISQEILDSNQKGDLALILLSENQSSYETKIISDRFKEKLTPSKKKVLLTSNLMDAKQYFIKIIICSSGKITKNELYQIKEDIDLQNNEIKGLIFIDK